jgi:hypothetical protein
MNHLYWSFDCKTPGCNTPTAFTYGGIYDKAKGVPFFISNPSGVSFMLVCPACKQAHQYDEKEIRPEISETEPPEGFPRLII